MGSGAHDERGARYRAHRKVRSRLGVADPDVLPLLENELSRADLACFNPEGHPRRREQLHALLSALAALAAEPTFEAVAALARCPDFSARAADAVWSGFFPRRVSRGARRRACAFSCRQISARHDEPRTASCRRVGRGAARGGASARLHRGDSRDSTAAGAFPQNAVAALDLIFADHRFDLARADVVRAAGAAEGVARRHGRMRRGEGPAFRKISAADWWEDRAAAVRRRPAAEEKAPGALELQGWLELLWEERTAPRRRRMNDGFVTDCGGRRRVSAGVAARTARPQDQRPRASRAMRICCRRRRVPGEQGGRLDLLFAKNSA